MDTSLLRVLGLAVACAAVVVACGGAAPPSSAGGQAEGSAKTRAVTMVPPSACAAVRERRVEVPSGRSGSSLALIETGGRRLALIADEENAVVRVVDAEALRELSVTDVGGKPAQLLPLPDGRVAITLRDTNRLALFELPEAPEAPLELRCSRPTYAEPFGLAAAPDGRTLAVTSALDRKLTFFGLERVEAARSVSVAAEPRGVLFGSDGQSAYVGHLVGGVVSIVPASEGEPSAVFVRPPKPRRKAAPGAKQKKEDTKASPKEQELAASQGFALAEVSLGETDGKPWPGRVFVPMASSDPMQFEAVASFPSVYGGGSGGSVVIGAFVAVLDPVARAPLGGEVAPLRRARPEDCTLPRAMATSQKSLYVACMGTNTVVELDARAADPISAERRRFGTGEGPTGIVIDEQAGRALVFSQFSLQLTVIELAPEVKGERVRALPLARPAAPALDEKAALGRTLFHTTRDVRLSFDGRACASCHPDGRADALTWSTPDGPRQTISLAGRIAGSAPYGWFGDHATLKQHVRFTAERLGGSGLEDSAEDHRDLEALLAYVERIPVPSREGAFVEPDVEKRRTRGKELFYSAETACSTCHVGNDSDRQRHDVGSGVKGEASMQFDTPSLRLIGQSAPYFHDGRYRTLEAMLADPHSKMGSSAWLSPEDRHALVAYLEAL